MAAKGLAAQEAREAFIRAQALCSQVGETAELVQVLWGLVLFHTVQAQLRAAEEFCQQLFHLAQTQDDPHETDNSLNENLALLFRVPSALASYPNGLG